jgi:preprotein translocase subunit SecD
MFVNQDHLRPINTFPAWKYVMLVVLLAVGVIFALPNIYPPDPAIQITKENGSLIEASLFKEIQDRLVEKGLTLKSAEVEDGKSLIRFANKDDQFKASAELPKFLSSKGLNEHVVAINLAPTTPDWLKAMGGAPLNLGLDLRGGVQFLMQVDMDSAMDNKLKQYVTELKTLMRENKVHYSSIVKSSNTQIIARFRTEELRDKADVQIRTNYNDFQTRARDNGEIFELVLDLDDTKIKEAQDYAVDQNIATFRNRINELGVAEPLIQKQGKDRILIQLPGVQDSAQAKRILGKTATLEFRMVDQGASPDAKRAPAGTEKIKDQSGGLSWMVKKKVIVSGTQIVDAKPGFDPQSGQPQISVTLDSDGGAKMLANTTKNTGKLMAIVMVETKAVYERTETGELKVVANETIKEVVSAPRINGVFGAKFQVTGSYTPAEASEFALILRAGSLKAPTFIIEERTIGPSLGEENIRMGMQSIIVGFVAVLIFMLIYYRLFGLVANIALFSNLVFIVAIMSLIPGATLTLPGIAGIVLTVGMAVDANVLIFERIREELADNVNPAQAIHAGYDKAFSTIADANVTTLIAALVLFGIGTGPIAGFAVTLLIGIITSMFTAIVGTRAVVNLIYGGKSVKKLSI